MDKNHYLETVFIKDEIAKCEDLEELKEKIFPLLHSQQEEWARKINEIIAEKKYTKTRFAELCGVSRVTVDKWCKGILPKNRETFLRIGMAAGYDVERMNQLLQRYGRYPALYSKSLEDCVSIFVISHNYGEETAEKYRYILNKIKEHIIRDEDAEEIENISTVKFDSKLSEVCDEDGLEQFITDNIAMFANAYHKFYAYVKMNISANYMELRFADSVFEMAEIQGWSSSLRQCVSAIRQNKWYPTRNKIISLGLHLSMDHEQIDKMLELAHMEPLCAKNIFESVIMFILDDASLNNLLDIKLENIFWDEREKVYKLGDFGIAKYSEDGNAETVIYTDGYGAPEIERRLCDSYNVTADIYSFGITLYLLFNNLKFPGTEGYYPKVEIQYDPDYIFPAPENAPEGITGVIRKMCSYRAEDRYQCMADALSDLVINSEIENAGISEELIDMVTETYRGENTGQEETEPEERPKSRAERLEEQKIVDQLYREDSIKFGIIITLILTLLFRGMHGDVQIAGNWLFLALPAVVLFEALFQRVKEFQLFFGALAIGLIFFVGLSDRNDNAPYDYVFGGSYWVPSINRFRDGCLRDLDWPHAVRQIHVSWISMGA